MHFKGDVIITDPCYIIRHQERDYASCPSRNDFIKADFFQDKKLYYEQQQAFNKAYAVWKAANPDDWETCNCGENMRALGLHTFLCRSTIYGDWSCTTWQKRVDGTRKQKIGEFCADAGMVGVFLLSEVLAYNPDFNYHIEKPWTTTLINNFNGDIDILVKGDGVDKYVTVEGNGNIDFFTSQTGC